MELWIRSQDKKKLCQSRYLELDNDETGIFCFNGESYSVFAGKYKTKERALEVLDNIETIILLQSMYKYDNKELIQAWENLSEDEIKKLRKQICVYEMPEE